MRLYNPSGTVRSTSSRLQAGDGFDGSHNNHVNSGEDVGAAGLTRASELGEDDHPLVEVRRRHTRQNCGTRVRADRVLGSHSWKVETSDR